ncbi:dihydrofolate reductase family protein [Shigella flexneri]
MACSGESQWITSPQARRDVQRQRAHSHGHLTSSATVLADDPALTVRWSNWMNKLSALPATKFSASQYVL